MNRGILMALLAGDLFVMGISLYMVWMSVQRSALSNTVPASARLSDGIEPVVPSTGSESVAVGNAFKTKQEEEKSSQFENLGTNSSQPLPVKNEFALQEQDEKGTKNKKRSLGTLRKILFQYRDSVPKRVAVLGDFNQWTPQAMKKNQNHNWALALELKPGEYAYNFIVDGKMIRDPSNRKVKKANQKILSSLLIVKPK